MVAEEDLPRLDRSAVDGYAVKAEDTSGASQFGPKTLRITNEGKVGSGQATQLWTGNPLPSGADAVVMLESTQHTGKGIEVWVPATPGENVSKRGEDVAKGEVALRAGTRLKPHHLGLIVAMGKAEVNVVEGPKVAILATGNELADVGEDRRENLIFDVNRPILAASCLELGAEPVDLGIAGDDVGQISAKLKSGIKSAHMVITTGGTSVGGLDLVPEAVNAIGKPGIIVHGIAMRPAMPTALAVVKGKGIVVLSGNPVAAMVGFEVFARPLICEMLGLRSELRPMLHAEMKRSIATALGRKNFVRVRILRQNGRFLAEPVSARGSSIISTMTKANGFVVVPENQEGLEKGESVLVYLFDTPGMGC
jgi:molybdopterin molybdotransferase